MPSRSRSASISTRPPDFAGEPARGVEQGADDLLLHVSRDGRSLEHSPQLGVAVDGRDDRQQLVAGLFGSTGLSGNVKERRRVAAGDGTITHGHAPG